MLGEKAFPEKMTQGLASSSFLIAARNLAAPPTGSWPRVVDKIFRIVKGKANWKPC